MAGPSPESASSALGVVLRRLAVVLLTVGFAAVVALSGRGGARVIVAAFDTASLDRVSGAARSDLSQAWQAGAPSRACDLKAIEADGDDDDDDDERSSELEEHGTPSSLCRAPALGKPERVLRGALPADTSRFARSPCLPRGPPLARA